MGMKMKLCVLFLVPYSFTVFLMTQNVHILQYAAILLYSSILYQHINITTRY